MKEESSHKKHKNYGKTRINWVQNADGDELENVCVVEKDEYIYSDGRSGDSPVLQGAIYKGSCFLSGQPPQ